MQLQGSLYTLKGAQSKIGTTKLSKSIFCGYETQESNPYTEAQSALGLQLKGIESQQFNASTKSLQAKMI